MAATMERLALDLLGLPRKSRALLAGKLLESLDEESDDPAEVEQAWIAEAQLRLDGLKEGEGRCEDAYDALRDIEKEYAE